MQLKNGLFFVQLVSLYRTLEICQFSEIFSFHKYVMKQIRDLKKKTDVFWPRANNSRRDNQKNVSCVPCITVTDRLISNRGRGPSYWPNRNECK